MTKSVFLVILLCHPSLFFLRPEFALTLNQQSSQKNSNDIGIYESRKRETTKERLPSIQLPPVVSEYVMEELRSVEEPEAAWLWFSNKFKYFFLFPFTTKTIQGMQGQEFVRAAKQAQWIAVSTQDSLELLYEEVTDLQGTGKISNREADIVKDTMQRIQTSATRISYLFSYAAHKMRYYGHVRADKEISKKIDMEAREIEQALSVLKRIALEKGVPRALSIDLRLFLKLIEDIISPHVTSRSFKDIEKSVHDITSSSNKNNLELEYKKKIFGKQHRITMLKEHQKYLKARNDYYAELRVKLEHQIVEVPSFKRKISPILKDLDSKVKDLRIRDEATKQEIKFIKKELDIYRQAFQLCSKIFKQTQRLMKLPPIDAGKGLLILR